MIITSKENKIFKEVKKLKTKKYRDKLNKFLIEGTKIFKDFKENSNIEYILIDENQKEEIDFDGNKYILRSNLFEEISSQQNSQGLIMVCSKKETNIEEIKGHVFVLDNVQDPGNLGTIIRTLSSFGIKNLIITNDTVDEYSEKVLRSSMGTIFNMNIHRLKSNEIIDFLKSKCYNTIITTLDEDSISINEIKIEENTAFIFGNEGKGISETFRNLENAKKVIIPIEDNTESLNVAITVAIFAYKLKNT